MSWKLLSYCLHRQTTPRNNKTLLTLSSMVNASSLAAKAEFGMPNALLSRRTGRIDEAVPAWNTCWCIAAPKRELI